MSYLDITYTWYSPSPSTLEKRYGVSKPVKLSDLPKHAHQLSNPVFVLIVWEQSAPSPPSTITWPDPNKNRCLLVHVTFSARGSGNVREHCSSRASVSIHFIVCARSTPEKMIFFSHLSVLSRANRYWDYDCYCDFFGSLRCITEKKRRKLWGWLRKGEESEGS